MPHLPSLSAGCAYEQVGFSSANTRGTTITAAAAANTYGSWTELSSATALTWEYFVLHLLGNNGAHRYTVDVGIGSAGNEWVIAQSLPFQGEQTTSAGGSNWHLPLHVPAGSRVSARVRSSSSTAFLLYPYITGYTRGPTGAPGYSRMVALHDTTTCYGVSITPSSTNTKTSWTQIIGSTAEDYNALMVIAGGNGDNARTSSINQLFDIGIGAASSEAMIVQEWPLMQSSTSFEYASNQGVPCLPIKVPSGSRISARLQADATTAGDCAADISVYGFK